jgi:nicotinate-nucleotide adenylyltransferase
MKIGLLGGSFNPIHNGHLSIAETAKERLNLEEIWFVPTGNHPFKPKSHLLSFDLRVKLISKAIEPYNGLKISMLDSNPIYKNYTYHLIKKLKSNLSYIDPVFIIGSDILKELKLWFKYEWLLQNVTFVVVRRPGKEMIHDLTKEEFDKLLFLEMDPIPISSSEIRIKIKKNQPISGLVPESIRSDLIDYYKDLNTVV